MKQFENMDREVILKTLPDLVTIDTFVKSGLIEIDRRTLQRWCVSKTFPHGVKRGKFWYLRPRQFMNWFEGRSSGRHSCVR